MMPWRWLSRLRFELLEALRFKRGVAAIPYNDVSSNHWINIEKGGIDNVCTLYV
jgi:hypothetical protein